MIEIKKAELTDDIILELIELSKIWVDENISFGLVVNTKEDIKEPCYLALDNNKIVGYIFGHYYDNEKRIADIQQGDKCFEIDELYILKEYRSQGIGRLLFQTLEKEVKDNVKWITLPTATRDYKRILKFYDEIAGMTFHSAFLFKKC